MRPLKIVSSYRPRGDDDRREIFMERRRQSAMVDANLRAISYLREAMVRMREEIGELEEELSRTEMRIDYYEALLGFLRA